MFNQKISRRSFLTASAMTAAVFFLDWRKISASVSKLGPKDSQTHMHRFRLM